MRALAVGSVLKEVVSAVSEVESTVFYVEINRGHL